jgi:DNA-binding winged helix-turn-helix (wHTH) protein
MELTTIDERSRLIRSIDLSFGERQLKRGKSTIQLASRALDILITLIEQASDVVGQKDLLASTWPDVTVDGGVLRVHIAALRKAAQKNTRAAKSFGDVG